MVYGLANSLLRKKELIKTSIAFQFFIQCIKKRNVKKEKGKKKEYLS